MNGFWLGRIGIATLAAGVAVAVTGCGSGGAGTAGVSPSAGTTASTSSAGLVPAASPTGSGEDVLITQVSANTMVVGVAWPTASGRLISSATRRIDVAITGPGITSPPSASIVFPETEAELAASAGVDRVFRFTEFDANGNLLKQSYVRLPVLTAAGSAWVTGATQQYGPFYLGDQHYGMNQTPGVAFGLPTDGTLTQVQVLDTMDLVDATKPGPNGGYEAVEWYYFDVPSGPRQFVTITMTNLEQVWSNSSNIGGMSFAVSPDGVQPVGFNSVANTGVPVGAGGDLGNAMLVDGTPSVSQVLADEPALLALMSGSPTDRTLETLLPQGRYFVRVCFYPSSLASLSSAAGFLPGALALADTTDVGANGAHMLYRLRVEFSETSPVGGVTQ